MRLQRIFSVCLSALMLATGSSVLGPTSAPQAAQASPTASHDVTSRPDKVSAFLTARLEHHRVQVTDFDATDSTTYANPDGSFTTEISSAPIRTHGPSGLVPIDTHLVGSGSAWKVAAADGDARISGGGSGDVAS